jgi:uncharacterized repeat protein (TIGR01451 family)
MFGAVSCVGASPTVAATPGVAWNVSVVAQPTNLTVGAAGGQYVLVLTNMGKAEAPSTTVTVTDTLPAGVSVAGTIADSGWECSVAGSVVTCLYVGGAVGPLKQTEVLTIPVAVGAAGLLTNQVTVSSEGTPVAETTNATNAGAAPPLFSFLELSNRLSDVSGALDTGAGDHPFALTTVLDFPVREVIAGVRKIEQPVQIPKALTIELPAGLVGDPQAVSRCPLVGVLAKSCPASSQVGTVLIDFSQGLFGGIGAQPIYNVVPERGYPAEFGAYVGGLEKVVFMYATVGPPPEYRLRLLVPSLPSAARTSNLVVTFFGDPQSMDGTENSPVAFFTNPSDCSGGPLVTRAEAESYEEPGKMVAIETQTPPVSGCNLLQFNPSIAVTPNSTLADAPTGYGIDLKIPQSQTTGLEGHATPNLKNVTVTLPAGVSISPGAADGLVGCTAEDIDLTSSAPSNCPSASQVGTAEATTPILSEPLKGHIYVASPGCGGASQPACDEADAANGTLFGLYLELEGSGVVIKQHGTVSANPATGQLTTTFTENPQQPFSDLKLTLEDGPQAALANPPTCGEALTTSDMTPWSTPQTPDATPSWAFTVSGCEGSPFAPSFLGLATNTAGGAYTTFSTTFGRADRMQDLSAIQVQTPPGLLGMISHVAPCEEPQAAQGTCSAAAQIGTATVGAGSGSHPLWVSGPVYLTGPYKGAPFGLSVAIPAKAGPFNLGTVVVRAAIAIDPNTAAITISSDPLPQIIDGVPLRLQTVNVTVNRPQFIFNPTSCTAQQVSATITSAQGAVAHDSSPFAAGGCQNLPFKPGLTATTQAKTSKANGASLAVKVALPPGSTNIKRVDLQLPKVLPARLTTLQKACTEAQFNLNPAGCPVASNIGTATARTPVLNVPLTGPAYLVSHGGAGFPDVEFVLQGQGVQVDLDGKTEIKKGITYSKFETVPDAPVSSFQTTLPEGPHSVLSANGSLCAKKLILPTTIEGQNGAQVKQNTKLTVSGCPKVKKKTKKKVKKKRK